MRRHPPIALVPAGEVEALSRTGFQAVGREPWLRLDLPGPVPSDCWVRIRYGSGWLDDPVRPILRIDLAGGGRQEVILPGPVCGAAVWVGRLPPGATDLSISPALGPGRFVFSIDGFETVSRARLLAGAFLRKPGLASEALYNRIVGRKVRARHFLASIWGSTPFGRYRHWLREREGPPLPMPEATTAGPTIALLIDAMDRAPADLDRTLRSVESQTEGAFGAVPLKSAASDVVTNVRQAPSSRRAEREGYSALHSEPLSESDALRLAERDFDWVGRIAAGDILSSEAAACLQAAARRDAGAAVLYCDDDRLDADGMRSAPRLKPDWSPRLNAGAFYLDGLTLVRTKGLGEARGDAACFDDLLSATLADPAARVAHVRRILLHRREPVPGAASGPMPASRQKPVARRPSVSVVIPNRDRLDLIEPCMSGLLGRTDHPDLEIVVVDNGSEEQATRDYYRSVSGDPRVRLLDRPGRFNYSALVNAGVAAARGEVVVLLNNDIEVIGADWLSLMVEELRPADVGAVGAKLLYPDGRLQHAGVVVGLDKLAGHLYRGRPGDTLGWMSRLSTPHEVSAVTGACMALARAKFEAVGGLDEEFLPISFNDIDLCLKLRRAGFRNLMVPGAVLYHRESASRGRDASAQKQARAEREAAVFASRWRSVMRDDPYFHPGLSQLRFDLALG